MKCPKCNYISFDNLTSCKKCGFVFKKGSSYESAAPFGPPVSDTGTGEEDSAQAEKPPDISRTVASIKESLSEIEADEPEDTENLPEEQSDQIEFDVVKDPGSDTSVEEDKKFPTFNEVNWGESISISSDELNLDSGDFAGKEGEKEGEIRFDDEESDTSDTKTEKLKGELERIGEELKQIEEEPEGAESAYQSDHPDMSFDILKVRKGGFWIRFIAYTIDGLLLNVLGLILMRIGIFAFGLGSSGMEGLEVEEVFSVIVPYFVFMVIINITYYTYFHGSTGQTLGKMVCKLKVVRVNGNPLGYGKAFLRWIGYIISSIFYLGFLWAAWDKNKQAWHDKIAGTYVIRI